MCSRVLINQHSGLSLISGSAYFRPSPLPDCYSIAKPCPEHKGSLCEVFTYPHHPPLRYRPSPLSPHCGWCAPFAGWWTERDEAKVHTPLPVFTWQAGWPPWWLRGATSMLCLNLPQTPHQHQSGRPPTWTTICPLSSWPLLLCQAAVSSAVERKKREECYELR